MKEFLCLLQNFLPDYQFPFALFAVQTDNLFYCFSSITLERNSIFNKISLFEVFNQLGRTKILLTGVIISEESVAFLMHQFDLSCYRVFTQILTSFLRQYFHAASPRMNRLRRSFGSRGTSSASAGRDSFISLDARRARYFAHFRIPSMFSRMVLESG